MSDRITRETWMRQAHEAKAMQTSAQRDYTQGGTAADPTKVTSEKAELDAKSKLDRAVFSAIREFEYLTGCGVTMLTMTRTALSLSSGKPIGGTIELEAA